MTVRPAECLLILCDIENISIYQLNTWYLITLPIPKIENPPTKSAGADPITCSASLSEALMETDTSDLPAFDLGIECTKCSGEYGKKRQYEVPVSRSLHGFAYLQSTKKKSEQ